MRLLWLPEVLRSAGLTVHEYPGWQERGASTFGPVIGGICHGTGGSLTSSDAGELRVLAITGSNSAPAVPISQLYLSRSGAVWVVASGTATGVKTGTGGPLKGHSDDSVLQVEAQHSTNEPWTDVQYNAYVRLWAALCSHSAPGYDIPVWRVVGHYEHQPTEKTDPWFDMNQFRQDVTNAMEGTMLSQETLSLPAQTLKTGVRAPASGDTETVDAATAVAWALRNAWRAGEYSEANYEMLKTVVPVLQQLAQAVTQLNEVANALRAAVQTLPKIELSEEQLAIVSRSVANGVVDGLGVLRFESRTPL